MNDKLIKPDGAPIECVAEVVEETGLSARTGLAVPHQQAVVERVRELVPYDYIWNEQTRNYEPVFVPGNEVDIHLRQNEEANARLKQLRAEKEAARAEMLALRAENERLKALGKG